MNNNQDLTNEDVKKLFVVNNLQSLLTSDRTEIPNVFDKINNLKDNNLKQNYLQHMVYAITLLIKRYKGYGIQPNIKKLQRRINYYCKIMLEKINSDKKFDSSNLSEVAPSIVNEIIRHDQYKQLKYVKEGGRRTRKNRRNRRKTSKRTRANRKRTRRSSYRRK
jgi:hypothetical protein